MKKILQQYAKDLTAGRLASGYEHSYRIYHLSRQIAEGIEYDDDVLHAACFLHDIERMVDHSRGSAEKAKNILEETGFPAAKISKVVQAILSHMPGESPQSVEGKLLHDANLLDSIGAIGFARLSIGAFFWYHYKSLQEVLEMVERELSFADHLFFPKSRDLAREKKEFMKRAVEVFRKELRI